MHNNVLSLPALGVQGIFKAGVTGIEDIVFKSYNNKADLLIQRGIVTFSSGSYCSVSATFSGWGGGAILSHYGIRGWHVIIPSKQHDL